MNRQSGIILQSGVGYKCDVVFRAIADGHREVAAVAAATQLPSSTVVRVAALLVQLGHIRVVRAPRYEFEVRAAAEG